MFRRNISVAAVSPGSPGLIALASVARADAKALILGALNWQLRFVGGEPGECAKLEAEFMTALARSLSRTVFVVLLGLAYVVGIAVYLASGCRATGRTPRRPCRSS